MSRFDQSVDLDRLADYTAGVLPAHEAAAVAELIATQPDWARAHADLITANASIRADLASAAPESMPADVIARVDAALARAASDPGRRTVLPRHEATPVRRGARRGRWRLSPVLAGVGLAAAAAIAVITGVSLEIAAPQYDAGSEYQASAPDAAAVPIRPTAHEEATDASAPQLLASGTSYQAGTLAAFASVVGAPGPLASKPSSAGGSFAGSRAPVGVPGLARDSVDSGLRRLAQPAALDTCLAAVVAAHPGSVVAVDFARYEGRPAIIVLIRQAAGAVVVAAGPDCGLHGPDEKGIARA